MTTTEATLWAVILACSASAVPYYSKATPMHEDVVIVATKEQKEAAAKLLCEHQKDCRALAKAVYYEARSEPIRGQTAVAYTVLNRTKNDRWPSTITGVINYRCQYSFTCDGSLRKGIKDKESWNTAKMVAWNALNGVSSDPTKGADHYFEPKKVKRKPFWARKYQRVAKIGNHVFYKS